LRKNTNKIFWTNLSSNPNAICFLTCIDYNKMRENCKPFAEELAAYVFHPQRLIRITEKYNIDLYEYLECI